MRLVRNQTEDGKCKYALVRLDRLRLLEGGSPNDSYHQALNILEKGGFLEYAGKGDPQEAFVIKLKDVHAPAALQAYELSAATRPGAIDHELSNDVHELRRRALNHPDRHVPDTIHPVA